jgi:flagellar export protein FliJ
VAAVKRFQFSLGRVLKLKEQRERMAELRLKQAQLALEQARAVVAAIRERLRQTSAALEPKIGNPIPPASWIAYYEHSQQLGRNLEQAEGHVVRARQQLQEAAAQRTQIATEVEALNHLRHQQWQEHTYDMMHLEQIRLDELGMRRWKAAQE